MDRIFIPRLIENLNAIAETFDKKPVSVKAAEMWFETLREFNAELVMGMLGAWTKTHGRFPVPAEVWKACNEISAEEREKQQRIETAKREKEYQSISVTQHGTKMLSVIMGILGKPKRTPVEHWRHVLATEGLPRISYDYANECLAKIDKANFVQREPGQDDEERKVA